MINKFDDIKNGNTYLGIEFGSTRIKAVLIDSTFETIAWGAYEWENRLENGIWTYSLSEAISGMQKAYKEISKSVSNQYNVFPEHIGAIGISGMMHGYLPFDKNENQLAEFRTWRNTITKDAAEKLTELLSFNIPQRWSVAHLYQAILNNEKHINEISYITTLAGYIHKRLTGKNVLGIGEASGMFPVEENRYNNEMIKKFDNLISERKLPWHLNDVLPKILCAGENAGMLTEEGAKLLDPDGVLKPGIFMCPPEGDAGTGMVATNSVCERSGNISAGTSIFAMVVLEKQLSKLHEEIDMITTPSGKPVAMVHCNTCTADLDAWVGLLGEMTMISGAKMTKSELYDCLYKKALEGDEDCGGLVSFNYYAGEIITKIMSGCPFFAHRPNSKMTLSNFMRTHIYSAVATLKIGMDILTQTENVKIDKMLGHGGLFKTKKVGQYIMASALDIPISVMETAGEGGPWGAAVLASYLIKKRDNQSLGDYLANEIFNSNTFMTIEPDKKTRDGFMKFLDFYKACIPIENNLSEITESMN